MRESPSPSAKSYNSEDEELEQKLNKISLCKNENNPDDFTDKDEILMWYIEDLLAKDINTFPKCPLLVYFNKDYYQVSCMGHFKQLLVCLKKKWGNNSKFKFFEQILPAAKNSPYRRY